MRVSVSLVGEKEGRGAQGVWLWLGIGWRRRTGGAKGKE